MKKFLTLLLVLTMVLAMLAACGTDSPKADAPQTNSGSSDSDAPVTTPDGKKPDSKPADNGKIDPFQYPNLDLTGASGSAKALSKAHLYVYVDGKEYHYLVDVDAGDKSGSLKNGDTVHLKLFDSQIESFKEDTGKEFSRTEADITVFGLNAFGDPNASSGQHNVVNLNDYIRATFGLGDSRTGEDDASAQFVLEYEQILRKNIYSIREDANPDDYQGTLSALAAARELFEEEDLVQIVCADHEYDASGTFTDVYAKVPAGESLTVSIQVNEAALAELQKVMNLEFTYSDFTATREN